MSLSRRKLHIGIDASNIRSGGGLTHLVRLLNAADQDGTSLARVTIWTSSRTAQQLPRHAWITPVTPAWCNGGLLHQAIGQQYHLPRELKIAGCHVLFSPGGTLPWQCPVPTVTMSQNMLPFEPLQADLFGRWSLMRLKMQLLRYSQGASFSRAQGLIFLTNYARNAIEGLLKTVTPRTALIPHGIEERFKRAPRPQRRLEDCSEARPFRVIYVSILMPYKHQIEVAQAIAALQKQGMPIEANFIGAPWGQYGKTFQQLLRKLDPEARMLKYTGHAPFEKLHELYHEADAFVFASSCENLPNILIEGMAAGLPIACSNLGPMPEVLGDAGTYFDPSSVASITHALQQLAEDHAMRAKLAQAAWQKAHAYSWKTCANDTFEFIEHVVRQHEGGF
ncbi:glycosyltransferase family 1 protein [Methylobacillus methanolivorans]